MIVCTSRPCHHASALTCSRPMQAADLGMVRARRTPLASGCSDILSWTK
jgi:hypothetical protein